MGETICTYFCPLRASTVNWKAINNFNHYWEQLSLWGCEVLIVDGSPREVFEVHAREWRNFRHFPVDPKFRYLNGKVNGIHTGVPIARHQKIILGDDDVRYTRKDIERMVELLNEYDLVRPQNFFEPLPFRAHIDTGRILLNRAFLKEGDFPGTFGFQKSSFLHAGEFDGDVLFDNEELVRHMKNRGAKICYANDFFVLRKPAERKKWLEQRPRQAYEDFVMKKRTAFFLSMIPVHLLLLLFGKKRAAGFLALVIAAVLIAKAGEGRGNGAKKFLPFRAIFFAPLWVLERSISVYLAVFWKIYKGGYPFGDRIISKGTGRAWEEKKITEKVISGETGKVDLPV